MLLTIYIDKRTCIKLKSLIIKSCVFRGDCLDIQDRDLCNNSPLAEAVDPCHKDIHTRCPSSPRSTITICFQFMERLAGVKLLKNIFLYCHFQVIQSQFFLGIWNGIVFLFLPWLKIHSRSLVLSQKMNVLYQTKKFFVFQVSFSKLGRIFMGRVFKSHIKYFWCLILFKFGKYLKH